MNERLVQNEADGPALLRTATEALQTAGSASHALMQSYSSPHFSVPALQRCAPPSPPDFHFASEQLAPARA